MNNKLEIVRMLLEEIESEQNKKAQYDKAEKDSKLNGYKWNIEWKGPYPNKARVKDNCRIARRLLADIAREVKN